MPQVFDLWQDPQERYDIFMNNFTERTWTMVTISESIKKLMKTYVQYRHARCKAKCTLARSRFASMNGSSTFRNSLAKEGVHIPMPTGN